jgi:hypothetical protein
MGFVCLILEVMFCEGVSSRITFLRAQPSRRVEEKNPFLRFCLQAAAS